MFVLAIHRARGASVGRGRDERWITREILDVSGKKIQVLAVRRERRGIVSAFVRRHALHFAAGRRDGVEIVLIGQRRLAAQRTEEQLRIVRRPCDRSFRPASAAGQRDRRRTVGIHHPHMLVHVVDIADAVGFVALRIDRVDVAGLLVRLRRKAGGIEVDLGLWLRVHRDHRESDTFSVVRKHWPRSRARRGREGHPRCSSEIVDVDLSGSAGVVDVCNPIAVR